MNTTIRRITLSAPVAVALLGFSVGSADAAPYDPASADKVQVQPAGDPPEWDVDFPISDDLPDVGPVDPDDVGPADPADEPVDEPADEPSEDDGTDEESDEDADNDADDSDNGGGSSSGNSDGSDNNQDGGEADDAPAETAAVQVSPASASGVHVAPGLIAAAGAALAGVAGWAGYRRTKLTA